MLMNNAQRQCRKRLRPRFNSEGGSLVSFSPLQGVLETFAVETIYSEMFERQYQQFTLPWQEAVWQTRHLR